MPLSAGDAFPSKVVFQYAPSTKDEDTCGMIEEFKASEKFAGKRVILISVPGAFTPGCHMTHLPGFLNNMATLKEKKVDLVVVIATNDAWVMEAWSKNRLRDVDTHGIPVLFMADDESKFSAVNATTAGPTRTGRYAYLIDNGKITYAGYDEKGIKESAFEALSSKL